MDSRSLHQQNLAFQGTSGVSRHARGFGLHAAFLDKRSGRIEVARMRDGRPASFHLIQWLPVEWASKRGPDGSVQALRADIVAGFERDGVFLTREEAAEL